MNIAFVDIGELGWSLLLSARVRWIKRNTSDSVAIITYPDRRCLYTGMADIILDVPGDFCTRFDIRRQDCFGLYEHSSAVLTAFFKPHIPKGYTIPDYFHFSCPGVLKKMLIFEPYKYVKKLKGKKEILVFPRYRDAKAFKYRNLSEHFYHLLIKNLCDAYPNFMIRTVGTILGAYNIDVKRANYVNWVGKSRSVQDIIDQCQLAVVAVGGTSAPPKITLLQGVPTFIIGHEKSRFLIEDNWMKTKVGFYTTPDRHYNNVDITNCICKIVDFVRSCV